LVDGGRHGENRARAARGGDPIVRTFGGRLVKTTGDGVLLEFPSVVAAVECAIAIKKMMEERNASPEAKCILYRVGVNLGDILIDREDILGDGVNVASRLEGICCRYLRRSASVHMPCGASTPGDSLICGPAGKPRADALPTSRRGSSRRRPIDCLLPRSDSLHGLFFTLPQPSR
jgi:hypothetical protein